MRQIKPAQLAFRCTINIILLTYLLTYLLPGPKITAYGYFIPTKGLKIVAAVHLLVVSVAAGVTVESNDMGLADTLTAGRVAALTRLSPRCVTSTPRARVSAAVPTGYTEPTLSPAGVRLALTLSCLVVTERAQRPRWITVAWLAAGRIGRVQAEKSGFALVALNSCSYKYSRYTFCHSPA